MAMPSDTNELTDEIATALSSYTDSVLSRHTDTAKIAERLVNTLNANSLSTFECVDVHEEDGRAIRVVIKETPPLHFNITLSSA